jgi:hypothetical protein
MGSGLVEVDDFDVADNNPTTIVITIPPYYEFFSSDERGRPCGF